jgi:serine/threonine protein kinase HipA of HipAB toxin-antitoxin module
LDHPLPQGPLPGDATPPALKYESDGGPGIRQIMQLLLSSSNALED